MRGGHRPRRLAALLAVAALVAACGDDDGDTGSGDEAGTTTTEAAAAPSTTPGLEAIDLDLHPVATLDEPIALAARPGTPDLYIAEKGGTVRRVVVTPADDDGELPTYRLDERPVVDIADAVVNQGEQGLLGITFSSDGRRLFLYFTARDDGANTLAVMDLGDGGRSDGSDLEILFAVEDPAPNHNGGQLALGPDGYLYVALGDGGGAGDPQDTGQDPSDLLGSILRIDPDGADSGKGYAVPSGNPSLDGAEPSEVWAYGLRNPWRFSFDRATGDLWIADVGQGDWEEIDLLPAVAGRDAGRGANLGWSAMEGRHPFEGGREPDGAVPPIFEYDHGEGGCSVTGGYRYRGSAVPALTGVYLFADYCLDTVEGIELDEAGTAVAGHRAWELGTSQIQSFGEDGEGELYVLEAGGTVSRVVAR
ncbi:MAG: PQQ-dependent sugar dehydrogenase [Actinomycetota bacterium]|nr:PQQ-dependent sugar dehydrogenase [Actinomycetota bacterium]